MAVVKTHIPGTSVSIGYESESTDRAIIRCLVTGVSAHQEAIDASVAEVGETLYSGSMNIPLSSAESTRFGDNKYIVTLQYTRSQRARRRDQTERRIRIKSTNEYVDAYLTNGGSFINGYRDSSNPSATDWASIQFRPGNLQSPELYPRPYKQQRPNMVIELEYTTAFLTINDAELQKSGKLNSNTFPIPEIGGVFAPNSLKYEGFTSSKRDLGEFPWSTSLVLVYDPSGHYRQQAVWDQSLDSGNGKWKTISTNLAADSTTF